MVELFYWIILILIFVCKALGEKTQNHKWIKIFYGLLFFEIGMSIIKIVLEIMMYQKYHITRFPEWSFIPIAFLAILISAIVNKKYDFFNYKVSLSIACIFSLLVTNRIIRSKNHKDQYISMIETLYGEDTKIFTLKDYDHLLFPMFNEERINHYHYVITHDQNGKMRIDEYDDVLMHEITNDTFEDSLIHCYLENASANIYQDIVQQGGIFIEYYKEFYPRIHMNINTFESLGSLNIHDSSTYFKDGKYYMSIASHQDVHNQILEYYPNFTGYFNINQLEDTQYTYYVDGEKLDFSSMNQFNDYMIQKWSNN